jgi:hypothetical protein
MSGNENGYNIEKENTSNKPTVVIITNINNTISETASNNDTGLTNLIINGKILFKNLILFMLKLLLIIIR